MLNTAQLVLAQMDRHPLVTWIHLVAVALCLSCSGGGTVNQNPPAAGAGAAPVDGQEPVSDNNGDALPAGGTQVNPNAIQANSPVGTTTNTATTTATATTVKTPTPNNGGGGGGGKGNDTLSKLIAAFSGGMGGFGGSTSLSPDDIGTGCVDGDDFTCKAEAALLKYTNDIRARHGGLPPMVQHFRLSWVARDWSIKQGPAISHNGFPSARVSVYQNKFPGKAVPGINAENVAMNQGGADPDAVAHAFADQWEHSSGHLANILGSHHSVGLGIHCAGHDGNGGGGNSSGNSGGLGGILSGIMGGMGGSCTGTQIFTN